MRLAELAHGLVSTPAYADREISAITEDSRRARRGSLFVAVPGTSLDGHAYVPDAVSRGAAAVVVERAGAVPPDVPFLRVPSARIALAELSARLHRSPPVGLRLIGFTGTRGKTSTSEILRSLLDAGGSRTAVMGSLGARHRSFADAAGGLTTATPPDLHRCLRRLKDSGADVVVLEVTSHALKLQRLHGLTFAGGMIGAVVPGEHNASQRSYDDYVDATRLFLDYLANSATLAYDADNRASRLIGHKANVRIAAGVSLDAAGADVCLRDVLLDGSGATFTLGGSLTGASSPTRLRSSLLGRGHLRNVALALTCAIAHGVSLDAVRDVLGSLRPLRRRMERYDILGRVVLDDAAGHPEDLGAAFDVARLLGANSMVAICALRGGRGADINRRNALALADLASIHGVRHLIITASSDRTGEADRVQPAEVDAARQALVERGRRFVWHDSLAAAARDGMSRSGPGNLLLLLGAQGMDDGRSVLESLD